MFIIFVGFLLSNLFLYLIFPILKKSFLDYPVLRSSHTVPTPKGGGIVFALIGLIGSLIFESKLILICLPIAILSSSGMS